MMPPALTMTRPDPLAVLEFLKPIIWFAPMWAFARGVVSSGVKWTARSLLVAVALGLLLPGAMGSA